MRKLFLLILAGLLLLGILGIAYAQTDTCPDNGTCTTCQNSWIYNLLLPGIVAFAVFLYMRYKNRVG